MATLVTCAGGINWAELIQLKKQVIKLDTDSNRYYILITDAAGSVKTENTVRQVPIHQQILNAGFLEFVEN